MKMFLGLVIALGYCHFCQAQETFAYTSVENVKPSTTEVVVKNQSYLTAVRGSMLPLSIRKFRRTVADFDIRTHEVWEDSEKPKEGVQVPHLTYSVLLEEGGHKVMATYDNQGNVVKSAERYKGVNIPKSLRKQLATEYPGWAFTSSQCEIDYIQGKGNMIRFKIGMEKDGKQKQKRLRFDSEALAYLTNH
ncbi:hypothetical protein [Sediminicola luteus]|uniref:Beta-lactamase-inhibitor-like PepSY-like domain-containing protein n=1 Tax=Sediminicola luteus TaxID=319238 RepID=A0A2A4GEE3_9FLAO|nr:hypothetical protein [Sediminicola luteus]PCE66112.1 hypothetical protein B7P33_02090 [Sediminicola luteus]